MRMCMVQRDQTRLLSGYLLFRDFCLNHLEEAKPLVEFYEEVRRGRSAERKVLERLAESEAPSLTPWQTFYACAFHQIKKYEKLETEEERVARSREIFDSYIMKELLACSHVSVLVSCLQCELMCMASSNLRLEGNKGPWIGFTATSVLSSPFQRMLPSMSRATW